MLPGERHSAVKLPYEEIHQLGTPGTGGAYTYIGNDVAIDTFGQIWVFGSKSISVFAET